MRRKTLLVCEVVWGFTVRQYIYPLRVCYSFGPIRMSTRVLHFYRTYFPETQGGLEEVIRQICLNVKQKGVESRVFTLCDNPASEPIERPEALVFQSKRNMEIASCSIGYSALAEFKKQVEWADVVHYHFPWPFADVCHFLAEVKKPTVLTYHSDIVRQRGLLMLYRPLMNRFLASVDKIVCTSPNYFVSSPVLPCFAPKVKVVPIGINESSYPEPAKDLVRQVKETYGDRFFLFVGVLRYYKGLRFLLRAAKGADYKVVIAGAGPVRKELEQQIKHDGLDNVILAGRVPDDEKVALFQQSLAVVFPSYLRSEAFGVTLVEGAMYSKALISTDVGTGTNFVNIDGETGLVIKPACAISLRTAMDKLYAEPDLAKRMGEAARQRYDEKFKGDDMGKLYSNVYQQLLTEDGTP